MEPDLEGCNVRISAKDLLGFQRDLKEEKELLEKILKKIDDQVHRLQVEQLHLLGMVNKCLKRADESPSPESENESGQESTNKSLDLSIPMGYQYFDEEVEDKEDGFSD